MQRKNTENNKGTLTGIIFLILIAIVIIILLLLRGCQDTESTTSKTGIVYDQNQTSGGWEILSNEAIIEELNKKVEEGMINISMNTNPVFEDSDSAGNLMIVNESCNNYPQIVEITRNDTGELIYKSGAIAVGNKIEYAKLDSKMPAGTYECTAMFNNVDPDTGEYLGRAGAIINIYIKN